MGFQDSISRLRAGPENGKSFFEPDAANRVWLGRPAADGLSFHPFLIRIKVNFVRSGILAFMEHTIQVHAHDVLNLVDENPGAFDTATLPVKVREVFGMEASFYACSAADMTAEELLVFLFARQKLVEIDGRIHLNRANICQH